MATLEFFYDFNSPYSYLASTQLDALAARTGASIVYRPFVLGGVFKGTNNVSPALAGSAAKAQHLLVDLQRWAKRYGVTLIYSHPFPLKSISALRAALAAAELGQIREMTHALFHAHWGRGVNLGEIDKLAAAIGEAGFDPKAILSRIEQQDLKDKLRANTDEAVRRGAFGAPAMFVGEELYWGNDRLPFVEEALRRGSG